MAAHNTQGPACLSVGYLPSLEELKTRARLRALRESGRALTDEETHRKMVELARRLTGSAA